MFYAFTPLMEILLQWHVFHHTSELRERQMICEEEQPN